MKNDVKPVPDDSKKKHIRRRITVSIIMVVYLLFVAGLILIYRRELSIYINDPENFRIWIDSFGFSGRLIYILIVAVQVVLAVIHDGPLQIAGGYAFGSLQGALYFIVGFVLGSLAAFLLARRFGKMFISLFFHESKYEKIIDDLRGRNLYILVFLLYLVPGAPKDLLTYCFGTTNIKLHYFLLLAALGRFPAVLLTTLITQNIVERNIAMILGALSVALLLYFAGLLTRRYLKKRKQQE